MEEEYQQSSTAQNLDLLRNISSCVTETRKVRGQVRDYQLASRAPDLVKTEALQAKLKLVEALVHDLEASIASQKILTERLQQPFKEQHFKLEAQYHENAMSMFENISKIFLQLIVRYKLFLRPLFSISIWILSLQRKISHYFVDDVIIIIGAG